MKHAEVYLNEHRSDGLHAGVEAMMHELKGAGATKLFIEAQQSDQPAIDQELDEYRMITGSPGFDLDAALAQQNKLYADASTGEARQIILQNTRDLMAAAYGIDLIATDSDEAVGLLTVYSMIESKRTETGLPLTNAGTMAAHALLRADHGLRETYGLSQKQFDTDMAQVREHILNGDYFVSFKQALDTRMACDKQASEFIDRNTDEGETIGVFYGYHHGDVNRQDGPSIPTALQDLGFTFNLHHIAPGNGTIETDYVSLPHGHPARANPPRNATPAQRKPDE